jgi:Na+-driven multidrug efflux pump
MDVMTGILRGMGSSIAPMLITNLGVCGFRIGWIYTIFQMPQYHTWAACTYPTPISWLATFLVQLLAYFLLHARLERNAARGSPFWGISKGNAWSVPFLPAPASAFKP